MMPVFDAGPRRPLFAFPEHLTEATVRLVAGGVCLTIVGGFLLRVGWVLPLLAVGFALRVLAGPRYSPLARLAILLTQTLHLSSHSIAGPPKQFAAAIGAATLTIASILFVTGSHSAAWIVGGLVAILAGLEAAFAFCLGCRIYDALFGCGDCVVPRPGTPEP
jgi:hypothetical protein